MFDYLRQFKSLPNELRDKVSSKVAMSTLAELEKKYNVFLAATVMKVMVKSITLKNLPYYFITEFSLNQEDANKLTEELKEKIFFNVSGYLGFIAKDSKFENQIDEIINEAKLDFISSDLKYRTKKLLITYLKGIRSKLETRMSLEKSIDQGGIGLKNEVADNLIKITNSYIAKQETMQEKEDEKKLELPKAPIKVKEESKDIKENDLDSLIEKDIRKNEKDYNLKKEIESGRVKLLDSKEEPKQIKAKQELKSLISPEKILKLKEAFNKEIEKKEEERIEEEKRAKEEEKRKEEERKIEEEKKLKEKQEKEKQELRKQEEEKKREEEKRKQEEERKIEEEKKQKEKQELRKQEDNKYSFAPKPKSKIVDKIFKEHKKEMPQAPLAKDFREKKEDKKKDEIKLKGFSPIKPRPVADSGFKPKIEDIKSAPKVMGPIEELRYLDLINFRRLADDPKEITKKIKSKIDILNKEGYDKRLAAINAWKKSPVSRLYVKIGQEAINRGISIEEVIANREEDNKATLNLDEIKAIVSLNSSLIT